MKSFKSFILEMKKKEEIFSIAHPIHFKHVHCEKEKVSLDEIYSDRLTQAKSPFSSNYLDVNHNKNLGGPKKFEFEKGGFTRTNTSHLKKQANKIVETQTPFSEDHVKAIDHYTYKGNEKINRHLIAKASGEQTKELPTKHQTTIKTLSNLIKKNPVKIPHSVYSGISEDLGKQFLKRKKVKSPAFISATLHKRIAEKFAVKPLENAYYANKKIPEQHYLHIHLEHGDPATHISHESAIRLHNSGEYETLIHHGVTLEHIKTETHKDSEGSTVHVHHVRIAK